ncbi:ABC transporter permease [Halorussus salinus]|uniref:ABC transporter permease n=1 Tax=Halorussus salinus TaxID=1364935 RepID=UPI0010919924|nr:ABC transporter permease [Halorussus salinus]
MSRKSASLLTKTQRRRLRNDFEELNENKKRRDQQRIRDRLQAGTFDFRLLADLSDRQLELAFDDASDEELRAALSDAYLTVERIRELREYDRDDLIETARVRRDEYAADGDDAGSLATLELRTEAEVRDATETETEARLTGSRWTKYANAVMALGAAGFALSAVLWSLDQLFGTSLWAGNNALVVTVFVLIFLGLSGWTLIMGANVLKHDVSPYVRRLLDEQLSS